MNVKHEREKSNKRFSIVSIPYRRERDLNVKRQSLACDRKREREADCYMQLLFNFTDDIYGRETKMIGPLSMPEATEK